MNSVEDNQRNTQQQQQQQHHHPHNDSKCQLEIERLRTRLQVADEELTQVTIELQDQIDSLQVKLLERDDTITELQGRLDLVEGVVPPDSTIIDPAHYDLLLEENQQLKISLEEKTKEISELRRERENMQDALRLLETQVDNEIKLALSKTTQELSQVRADLEEAQNHLVELKAQKKEDEDNQQFVSKLIRDLETRNYLIDQLNDEVNRLRSPEHRQALVDGQYLRELFVAIRRRNGRNDWIEMGRAIGLTAEELQAVGLGDFDSPFNNERLSDIWISFLLREADSNVNQNSHNTTVSPSK